MKTQTKQINNIKTIIKENKNGFTIDLNGHFINKQEGFFIGITNLKGRNLNHLIKKVLYIKRMGFNGNKNLFIGGWCDNKNNFYLDLSLYVKERALSEKLALLFNQKAIYDLKKLDSIYLK